MKAKVARGFLLILFVLSVAAYAEEATRPDLDPYFGTLAHTTEATGFFRVQEINGRWWLITPDGHPFFSAGINGIRTRGSATADGVKHYEESVQRIYGSRQVWAEAQADRCIAWGWNTVGAWSDWQLLRKRLPYTVILNVADDDWRTGTVADFFDPAFRASVRKRIEQVAGPLVDDPFLVGYFLDNEMRWGPDHRGGHLLHDFMRLDVDRAGKQALVAFLKERYGTLDRLRADFHTLAGSWEELSQQRRLTALATPGAQDAQWAWDAAVARAFFTTTHEELRRVDPNHLNLGARFISQMVHPSVIAEAGKVVDVMSINFYDLNALARQTIRLLYPWYLSTGDCLAAHYKAGGRPILVSEWGYRAADVGLPNTWPPIYPTLATQADRADAFERYVRAALAAAHIVGHHWFIYTDQPSEGRFDGENNNFGLVNENNEPYDVLVERAARIHQDLYRPFETSPDTNDARSE